jgi:hypothetical protein
MTKEQRAKKLLSLEEKANAAYRDILSMTRHIEIAQQKFLATCIKFADAVKKIKEFKN